jgi:hypothetical protein
MSSDESIAENRIEDDSETVTATGALRRDELLAELELLREQNRRLHDSYVQAKRTQYRRTALGLAVLGIVAVLGGVLFPGVREVLLVLGATGLFGALLTYYLTPEQFVAASVGTAIYDAVADDRAEEIAELGLTETRLYVPVGPDSTRVRLFVPQSDDYTIPDDAALSSKHVVPPAESARGIAFRPTGEGLFYAFEDALAGTLGETPATLTTQLTDALVEQFDLVTQTQTDLDGENGRLTVGVSESVYGPVDRVDHPVASFLAVGLARGLGQPVTVETRPSDGEQTEYQITCRWNRERPGET